MGQKLSQRWCEEEIKEIDFEKIIIKIKIKFLIYINQTKKKNGYR